MLELYSRLWFNWTGTILQEMLDYFSLMDLSCCFPSWATVHPLLFLSLSVWNSSCFPNQPIPSSHPVGVPTTQRSPIRGWPFTPSLHGQPVKDFLCSRFVFFPFQFFFLLPLIEPLELGADGKIVVGGKVSEQQRERKLEEAMQRVRQPSDDAWWTEPLTTRKAFFHFEPQRDRGIRQDSPERGDIDSLSQLTGKNKPRTWRVRERKKVKRQGEKRGSTDESREAEGDAQSDQIEKSETSNRIATGVSIRTAQRHTREQKLLQV